MNEDWKDRLVDVLTIAFMIGFPVGAGYLAANDNIVGWILLIVHILIVVVFYIIIG